MVKSPKVCSECLKLRERCRVVSVKDDGELVYICPQCYKNLDYDKYLTGPKVPSVSEGD